MLEKLSGMELIWELVSRGQWDASAKVARSVYYEYDFTERDLEHCVATGMVTKRERDEYGEAVDGNKYVIVGRDLAGRSFYTVGKILRDDEGRWYFFITAHRAE